MSTILTVRQQHNLLTKIPFALAHFWSATNTVLFN